MPAVLVIGGMVGSHAGLMFIESNWVSPIIANLLFIVMTVCSGAMLLCVEHNVCGYSNILLNRSEIILQVLFLITTL